MWEGYIAATRPQSDTRVLRGAQVRVSKFGPFLFSAKITIVCGKRRQAAAPLRVIAGRACFGGTGYTFTDGTAETAMGCGASKPPARLVPDPPAPQPPAAAAAPEQLPAPSAPEFTPPAAKPASAPAASSWDDWDDEDDSSTPTRSHPQSQSSPPQPSEHAAFRNASGVLCIGAVAAAAMEVGLRCTSCGQRVHRFEAHRWDESADYYTFRNYVRTRCI